MPKPKTFSKPATLIVIEFCRPPKAVSRTALALSLIHISFDAFDFGTLNLPHTYARLTYITRSIGSSRLTMLSGYASIIGYCSYPTKTKRISPSTFFHFENANVDPKFLTCLLYTSRCV